MGQFFGTVTLTPNPDGRTWTVDDLFSYIATNGDRVNVPGGFITDLASIPRFLWDVWPPEGKYTSAAIVHDRLYTTQFFTRARSDEILFEAMGDCGVDWWSRHCIWLGVHWFGWWAWNGHKKD
jgi:hypothetical protein